jgi:hypothetical protein
MNLTTDLDLSRVNLIMDSLAKQLVAPYFRMDRIIFSEIAVCRQFLEKIPGTQWFEKDEKISQFCLENCDMKEEKANQSMQIEESEVPRIICSVDTAYELERAVIPLKQQKNEIELEILSENTPKSLESIRYFLEDKASDFQLKIPPKSSLIQTNYLIDYSETDHIQKKIGIRERKKRNKPPEEFIQLLKKIAKTNYSQFLGKVYYGKSVIQSLLEIDKAAKSQQLNQLMKISPIKYYTLLEKEGWIELRFKSFISQELMSIWMKILSKILTKTETGLEMMRLSCVYEAWETDENYKKASSDSMFITINDIEFALQQKNKSFRTQFFDKTKKKSNNGAVYLQLTPKIEDNDFRIDILEKTFKNTINFR